MSWRECRIHADKIEEQLLQKEKKPLKNNFEDHKNFD